jgi:anaerobic selenocysteine-containing dehydrogenase/Fe-S-cluster-containing dehydrogenase component
MSEGLSRRSFLKLAATAGAAAAIPGCEPAARKIIPYVVPDENVIPGVPTYYATTCSECRAGCGIIAKVREGRVIKLEGNPGDPISQGSICARGQAALQGLYNPDRLPKPMSRAANGSLREISWDEASKQLNDRLQNAAKSGKDRIVFIGASDGPSLDNVTTLWLKALGSTRVIFWEPIGEEPARDAALACFGRRDLPIYRLDRAEAIVSFGADFLETWGSPVEYSRQYAEFRSPKMRRGTLSIGKCAYAGPRLGITGAKADDWLQARPGTEGMLAMGILNAVVNEGWVAQGAGAEPGSLKQFAAAYDPHMVSEATGVPVEMITRLASWLGQSDGAVALPGGDDPQTYIAAYVLNAITGNLGRTMVFYKNSPAEALTTPQNAVAAIQSIHNGEVDVVVVASGANPAYSMPTSWNADAALKRAPFVVWLGEVPDESAEAAHLLLPTHHPLETWRDSQPRAGVYQIGQPVMQPVFASRPLHDLLIESAHLAGGAAGQSIPWENGADAVNSAWQQLQSKVAADTNATEFWSQSLRTGGVFQEPKPADVRLNPAVLTQKIQFMESPQGALTLAAFPHLLLYDGRGANKPWLQEIPEPVSQIVWDSWVEIHPETAASLGLKKDYNTRYLYAGINVIEISTPNGTFDASVHITPTVMPGVLAIPIGQGHSAYGRYAKNRGVNLWSVLPDRARSVAVQVRTTDKRHMLVTPMGNTDMMGRSIVEAMSLDELAQGKLPKIARESMEERPEGPYEMYNPIPYPGHKWGMTIDVNACTGCSACVAACYAENNLAFVGRERVHDGHIMSWLRIESFIPPPDERGRTANLYMAPILCQHCDHAPCEPVCPVFASVHTREGLNAQIYNRCIGTRFCENNCPYKVRRFNWFAPEWPEPMNLQLNPDVTVRGAGVMEKCTFCIQRITAAEIDARTEERELKDGEIITACAQACPSRAITFGDLNDLTSTMVKRRADNPGRIYTMLPELNALPQITYLRSLYQTTEKS